MNPSLLFLHVAFFLYRPCSPCSVICFLWAVVEFCFICRLCKYYCLCVSFDKHAATEKYITEQYWIGSSLRSPGVVMPLMLWHATSFWWISLNPQCPLNVKVVSMYVKNDVVGLKWWHLSLFSSAFVTQGFILLAIVQSQLVHIKSLFYEARTG